MLSKTLAAAAVLIISLQAVTYETTSFPSFKPTHSSPIDIN